VRRYLLCYGTCCRPDFSSNDCLRNLCRVRAAAQPSSSKRACSCRLCCEACDIVVACSRSRRWPTSTGHVLKIRRTLQLSADLAHVHVQAEPVLGGPKSEFEGPVLEADAHGLKLPSPRQLLRGAKPLSEGATKGGDDAGDRYQQQLDDWVPVSCFDMRAAPQRLQRRAHVLELMIRLYISM
jgi:hypothetical protein